MDATPNELLDEHIAKRNRQNVQRVQRCRARKQSGGRCLCIEVTDWAATLDAFIKIGVLDAEQRNDDKAPSFNGALYVFRSSRRAPWPPVETVEIAGMKTARNAAKKAAKKIGHRYQPGHPFHPRKQGSQSQATVFKRRSCKILAAIVAERGGELSVTQLIHAKNAADLGAA